MALMVLAQDPTKALRKLREALLPSFHGNQIPIPWLVYPNRPTKTAKLLGLLRRAAGVGR